MEYATPLYALLGLAGASAWALLNMPVFKKAQIYLPNDAKGKNPSLLKFVIVLAGLMAWLSLSYALMRPRIPSGTVKNTVEVNDIFFVVDISRSMLANDFKPNRLEAAKGEIKKFVDLRPTDRIGLIIFSEKAFTLLPLSTDLQLVERAVEEIAVGFLGSGTNIGDALGLAVARGGQSLAENKVIVLLTDGVSNVGNMTPIQAAEEAQKAGIKIYTIGIGGSENARIPVQGIFGGTRYQPIPGGSIDLETLRAIAERTGGRVYTAGNIDSLRNILMEIDQLERTDIEVSGRVIYEEQFYPYLLVGALLLTLAHLMRYVLLKEVT